MYFGARSALPVRILGRLEEKWLRRSERADTLLSLQRRECQPNSCARRSRSVWLKQCPDTKLWIAPRLVPIWNESMEMVSECETCHIAFWWVGPKDSYQGTPFRRAGKNSEKTRLQPPFMAIPIRHADAAHVVAGCRTFFVTSSIAEKRNLLQSDRSAELFVRILYDYRAQGKFRLHEFVVMPDHFHVLLTVECDMTIERAVQFIKGGFAFRAGREFGFRAPVWQKGFSEVRITDGDAFLKASEYIRRNPVARRLVVEAGEYLYSSANSRFEVDPAPQGLKPVSKRGAERYG
jgi:REP-associated tyrosine transposase